MHTQFHNMARAAAVALIITVVTQILYMAISSSGGTPDRDLIWTLEVLVFLVIAIAGLGLLPARPLLGAAIAVGGTLNVIQAGMGLVMFAPLMDAGAAFSAVLAMAFLLYFAGKVAFGIAAMTLAADLWNNASGAAKTVGLLAGVAGLAAIVLNAVAILPSTDLTMPAGAAGTAAALFLAIGLLMQRGVAAD